jgi:acylphosphatase
MAGAKERTVSAGDEVVRVTVFVRGSVQGVGFRWWTRVRARELGLDGYARNTSDGRVEVVVQGRRLDCAALVRLLGEQPSTTSRPGRVESVSTPQISEPRPDTGGFVER